LKRKIDKPLIFDCSFYAQNVLGTAHSRCPLKDLHAAFKTESADQSLRLQKTIYSGKHWPPPPEQPLRLRRLESASPAKEGNDEKTINSDIK
jgi:hypothetical protein